MKPEDVRSIARSHSIKPDCIPKSALFRTTHIHEGNFDLFANTYNGGCDQSGRLCRGGLF